MTQDRKSGGPAQLPGGWWEEEDDNTAGQMTSLQGQLLVASPNIGDERFEKTVILMCHHDPESAMGLVINRPASSPAMVTGPPARCCQGLP